MKKLFLIPLLFLSFFSIETIAQTTSIPDNNFEQALIDLGHDSGALNGVVTTANISGLTSLNVSSNGIVDLTGIEDFTALTDLNCYSNSLTNLDVSTNTALTALRCYSNNLTNLDVSTNTALTRLFCYSNNLTSLDLSTNTALTDLRCYSNNLTNLDVSTNTALTILVCYSNNLTSLDVSSNTALTSLGCTSNNLTSLDVSSNTALTYLSCTSNSLTSLDVSSNTALTRLFCQSNSLVNLNVKNGNNTNFSTFNALNNPSLSCIEVDDVAYSTTNWTNKDATASYSVACLTYVPDDAFEQALINLGVDSGPLDGVVFTSNISGLTSLDVSNEGISDLTGIEDFATLATLLCQSNNLASLNLSTNTALAYLNCQSNNLTSLDVSTNTALTTLDCNSNNLSILNVQNGNNTNFTSFNTTNNPNLSCIQVDNVGYSNTNWTSIDATASYSVACLTYVPDDVFEQALIDLGFDSGPLDDFVLTSNISGVSVLDVGIKGIFDLTGIEDFTALTTLHCQYNYLTSLDLSTNTALTYLDINYNLLTSLDVSTNTALITLHCQYNYLTSLDVSTNTALTILNCQSNSLTSLDVSTNTALTTLYCGYNINLTSLDVSTNTALITLRCQSNNLASLDVSTNTAFTTLDCNSNNLSILNVQNGNNTNFTSFNTTYNPNLSCIQVDNVAFSNTNAYWTDIDATASYSVACTVLSIDDIEINEYLLYPNPVKDILNIRLNNGLELKQITIYNTLGQSVTSTKNLKINTANLKSGVYFVEVATNQGKSVKKIIIE